MKVIAYILLIVLTVGLLGFGVYFWLSDLLAERASDKVTEQLDSSLQEDKAKKVIQNNPVLREFIEEGETIDRSEAAFQTKEEAIQVIMSQFNPVELMELRNKVEDGLNQEDQAEIIAKLEEKLTEEQLRAIKAIAYDELY